MPGEGFIFDMISRLKSNNSYLNKPSYFDHKALYTEAAFKTGVPDPKKATPEQLEAIRERFRNRRKQNKIKAVISVVIALVSTICILLFAMFRIRQAFVN